MLMNKGRGRPRGRPDTRAALLAAARSVFLVSGYRGATVRAIAATADVDSALISYHFGSKQGLFAEALHLPCADPSALSSALAGPRAGLAARLLHAVVRQWDVAASEEVQLAGREENTLAVLREYLDGELRVRLAEFLGGPGASDRAAAAIGVLGGLIFTRYLNPVNSIASMPAHDVCRTFEPALAAALCDRSRPRGRAAPPPAGPPRRQPGRSTADHGTAGPDGL